MLEFLLKFLMSVGDFYRRVTIKRISHFWDFRLLDVTNQRCSNGGGSLG